MKPGADLSSCSAKAKSRTDGDPCLAELTFWGGGADDTMRDTFV